MAELSCVNGVFGGLPASCVEGNPIRAAAGGYFLRKGTTIPLASCGDRAALEQLVIDGTLRPVHKIFNLEDASKEKKVEESSYGRIKKNHPGFRGYKWMFDYDRDKHQALVEWEGQALDLIPYDSLGNLIYAYVDASNVKGLGLSYFDVEMLTVASADSAEKTVLELQETDTVEYANSVYTNPLKNSDIADRWNPADLKTITDVVITAGTVAGGIFTINIDRTSVAIVRDGAFAERGVIGATDSNLILLDGTGASVAIDSLTPVSGTPGEYTVDASTAVYTGGTIQYQALVADEEFFASEQTTVS